MEQQLQNITINGAGKINGGNYDTLVVNGTGSIVEECTANLIKVNGTASFHKKVNAGTMKVNGCNNIKQDLKINNLLVNGKISVLGNIEGNVIKIDGMINVKGTVNVEEMICNCGSSSFNEICGEKITINSLKTRSSINTIEATNIVLKNVDCRKISGDNVTVGKSCEIGILEYKSALYIGKGAKIDKIIKL